MTKIKSEFLGDRGGEGNQPGLVELAFADVQHFLLQVEICQLQPVHLAVAQTAAEHQDQRQARGLGPERVVVTGIEAARRGE